MYADLDWMSMKCDGLPVMDVIEQERIPRKHTDDIMFLKAALSHPLRTDDPSKATLFVVPSMLNLVSHVMYGSIGSCAGKCKCCTGGLCNEELLSHTEEMLGKSPWFIRKQGKDHVIVCSHQACERRLLRNHKARNIHKCNSITWEENSMMGNRCRIASTYVGVPCPHQEKQFTFAMVASMHPEKSTFEGRRNICTWLDNTTGTGRYNSESSVSLCGEGAQCPALASARFGFHVRGDTFGSSRAIDTILSGTVPIFTAPEQYEILPPYVPWKDMSVLVDISGPAKFAASLKRITPFYKKLKKAVDEHAPLVNWDLPVPFEGYMKLFQQCASKG